MGAQCIRTGVRLAFAGAIRPLARVPFLPGPDVLVVDVLHQPIHVSQVASRAPVPATYGHLIAGLAAVFVVLVVAQQPEDTRGVWHIAGAIGGNRGGR